MIRKYLALTIAVIFSFVMICSCSKGKQESGINQYLGDYSYSDPAVCMVYEPVEDEVDENGNPYYGIQYREIKDLDGLMASGSTLLIYFYSSMSGSGAEVTAAVEDLALYYNGKLNIVMIDALEYRELMDKYEIEAVPEFVLIKAGQKDQVFGSNTYAYWTLNDVISWVKDNGIT